MFRLLAIAQVALLAKRHLGKLDGREWRRLSELVRKGRSLSAREKAELRVLASKLEPMAFVGGAADRFSPVPLPKRLLRTSS